MAKSAALGYTNATDLADYLVGKGMPFRDAHHVSGTLVGQCVKEHRELSNLTLAELREASPVFENDVYDAISLKACVERRKLRGGPAPETVLASIRNAEAWMETMVGGGLATLDDIYLELEKTARLTRAQADRLKTIELEEEAENAYPRLDMRALLLTYLDAGKQIALVSDMRLTKTFLRQKDVYTDPAPEILWVASRSDKWIQAARQFTWRRTLPYSGMKTEVSPLTEQERELLALRGNVKALETRLEAMILRNRELEKQLAEQKQDREGHQK